MMSIRRQGGGERTMRKTIGLSWAASCYYVCLCASLLRHLVPIGVVRGFPDPDIAIPSPAYSLIAAPSAVLTIFHFFHLSYRCLDWPCPFVGYQQLIFPAWPVPHDACPMIITLRHPTSIYDRLLQFHF